ncbi:hypothetical protein BUALT_Bualt17G0082500 [Buddleja alternifolia]|uniref:Uncharacterized protein n=1 Tax=Buddleja alternifolia TaxID=168488 RepID=A0AAV6WDL6_9LAMI|nr:hypothetical protein BUALT_Bualt17G0082500 [Buddleja alternifolia]
MVKSYEEQFWLVTSILNSVLGLHLIFKHFFSSWLPLAPIILPIAIDLCYRLHWFSPPYRHERYFTTKPQIMQSIYMEILIVSLSESMFTKLGYKWVTLFAWLSSCVPGLWATFRRPCNISQVLSARYLPFLGGFVLWVFWYGNDDGHMFQVLVGSHMFGQSSELFIYHFYMEADRVMENVEYCYTFLSSPFRHNFLSNLTIMAKFYEEQFWLVTSILNSVLGLHLIFKYFFSSWLPLVPMILPIAIDLCFRLLFFASPYRHERYFKTKSKIMQSIYMEILIVSLSESMFTNVGYKWVILFAWLSSCVPGLWATFWRPCNVPQVLSARYQPFLGAFVLWVLWYGNDEGNKSQVLIGCYMLGQTTPLFIYHLYMEADRVMRNVEYCEWLLQEIRRGAIDRTQMLDDLFLARGV